MPKNGFDELDILRNVQPPLPDDEARKRAINAAMLAFDEAEKKSAAPQGLQNGNRLTARTTRFWREIMQRKFLTTPAIASLVVLPTAGVIGWQLMEEMRPHALLQGDASHEAIVETTAPSRNRSQMRVEEDAGERSVADLMQNTPSQPAVPQVQPEIMVEGLSLLNTERSVVSRDFNPGVATKFAARPAMAPLPAPETYPSMQENRDRFEQFQTNPVKLALETPVSTFSIDVDTSSYSFVRRALKEGYLPVADSVRVEEMVNYFPYDWQGPQSASVPFNAAVTVMPTPWNEHTKLMHVAIKGYELEQVEKPRSNLVFLVDTSGSMNAPDKLPLLKNSFRMLLNNLDADDTVSIVTYAGNAGIVLEPTRVADRSTIMDALDGLDAAGGTAGEAGIRQAYKLAEKSFVEGGVNRIMLATDGDFNVGQTSDDELKKLVEGKRDSGIYLSVLGFGRGNLNDAMMQTIAQNGNGTAAYIDTLAEAEKVLVEEASSTLFPIAQDVKIQVEFNPELIAEYRLIGYETRALAREDFNNDRVDAGEIGSGHSVTAIYEITPSDSPARMVDDLRYGNQDATSQKPQDSGEYAFVKIRYKKPGEASSQLIEAAVTSGNEVSSFDEAGEDQRFSVAVAAFGQKLRGTDAVSDYGYDRIAEIANAARGADPFGYRAEFLSLVRLASALDEKR